MGKYSQAHQPIAVRTPLGADVLLLERLDGVEELSRLFRFDLELLAEASAAVRFEQLLAQPMTVTFKLPGGGERYVNGIVSRFREGRPVRMPAGDEFIRYRAELVPKLWLWTRRQQSRIFQHLTVPDILKQVLHGLDVSYQIQGHFEPRDYCIQYRESDFAFASRLMEEEGIYYFFEHGADGHRLVLADAPPSHPDVPGSAHVLFDDVEGGARAEDRVFTWEKEQEIRSSQVTLWDHCFELPGQNLAATQVVQDSVTVGSVRHPLNIANAHELEIYDYPGGFAGRVDGVDQGGGDRAKDLHHIFSDNLRTASIRMQEEAARAIVIDGESGCRQFMAGHRFSLDRHPRGKGDYVLTRVEHSASVPGYVSGPAEEKFKYHNRFQAIPAELPFRPERRTPKPIIAGAQTATVVGPKGEEIFCDKYGRIKVQFHWDRHGKKNAESSCWVRVGQAWAGKLFGGIYIPRVGQEVVVIFEEGDPDQPIVTGSVYNSEQMPPYALPENRMRSGFTSRSVGQGKGPGNSHELRFDDTGGQEGLHLHSENYMHHEAEVSQTHFVGWGERSGSGSGSGGGEGENGGGKNGGGKNGENGGGGGENGGGGEKKEGFWKAVKGFNMEGVWGTNFEFVLGGYNEVVVGEYAEVIAGINFELLLGFNFEAVFGVGWEIVVGPQFETIYGPSVGIRTGSVYEKVDGNVLEIINGDAIEIVNKGNLTFIVNGWVIESRKAADMARADDALVKNLTSQVNTMGTALGGAAGIAAAAFTGANQAATDLVTNVAAFAQQNPIPNAEAFNRVFLLTFGDLELVSKGTDPAGGNINIMALGAGKKITLAADTIELLANNVLVKASQDWNATTNPAFAAEYTAAKLASQVKVAQLEMDFLLETAEAFELEAESAIKYVMHGTIWLALMIIILFFSAGAVAAATATTEKTEP